MAWPFPIIFTGGVVPGLWRPIVGIDAFDLAEDEIDITPWLPLLCDGNAHTFEIRVSGLNDDGNGTASLSETTEGFWIATGKIFIWLDVEGHITTGQGPDRKEPPLGLQVTSSYHKGPNGTNETLLYSVDVQRNISFQSTINSSYGEQTVFWHQYRIFSNFGNMSEGGNIGINTQRTLEGDASSSGYERYSEYRLHVASQYETLGSNISIVATVNRTKDVSTYGQAVFPSDLEAFAHVATGFYSSTLATSQNGTATYLANRTSSASFGFGTTEQDMTLKGYSERPGRDLPVVTVFTELYHRHALAVNGTVIDDEERLMGEEVRHGPGHRSEQGDDGDDFCIANLQGRGGGWHER